MMIPTNFFFFFCNTTNFFYFLFRFFLFLLLLLKHRLNSSVRPKNLFSSFCFNKFHLFVYWKSSKKKGHEFSTSKMTTTTTTTMMMIQYNPWKPPFFVLQPHWDPCSMLFFLLFSFILRFSFSCRSTFVLESLQLFK